MTWRTSEVQRQEGLSSADRQAIQAFLAPRLDKLEDGLGAAVCGYVLEADNDSVITRIVRLRGIPHAHSLLSSLLGYRADRDVQRVFLEVESWDPAVARRLGEVLAAVASCGGYAARWPGSASSPEHLRALVQVSANLLQKRTFQCDTWLLSGPRCLELLSLDGGDQAQLVDVLFADVDRPGRHGRRRLLGMKDLARVLAAAPARTLYGARALDEAGRLSFLELLGRMELAGCPEMLEHLLDVLSNAAARESEVALAALTACDQELQTQSAARLLTSDVPEHRIAAVRLLRRTAAPAARALVAQHMDAEKLVGVRAQMRLALWEMDVLRSESPRAGADGGAGYVSIQGAWIAMVPAEPPSEGSPLPPGLPEELAKALTRELESAIAQANQEAQIEGRMGQGRVLTSDRLPAAPSADFELYSLAAAGELVEVLAGRVLPQTATQAARQLLGRSAPRHAPPWVIKRYRLRLEALLARPEITPQHLMRALILDLRPRERWARLLLGRDSSSIPARLLRERAWRLGDLRTVLAAAAPFGGSTEVMAELLDMDPPRLVSVLVEGPRPLLWPLVAEHLEMMDAALGLAPAPLEGRYGRLSALSLLRLLPAIPRRYLSVLIDLAVNGRPKERTAARALLSEVPDLQEPLVALLKCSNRKGRGAVAGWLRERGDRAALPWLRAALESETSDIVRAALLDALASLGDDLSGELAEERLLEDARIGLARTRTRLGRCVPLRHLPTLSWADGRPVQKDLVRWWLVLAAALQQPRGNAFLDLLLARLDADSAAGLGHLVLSSFITYDTRRASEEEANAFAGTQADRHVQRLRQGPGTWTDEALHQEREQAFARAKAAHLAEYVHSALPHRGILALASRARPSALVSLINTYLWEHPQRTRQCRALLDTLAHHGSALALQQLFSVARAYRRRKQREHAQVLLDGLASQRGLSLEALADHTIPTGGIGEEGVLTLPAGRSAYTARLDAELKVVLRNPQGRVVKALPAGSVGRGALTELGRQLKQTIPQQTVRLYEAMCLGRLWRAEELQILLRHPIARRLCQRLIFAGVGTQGELIAAFRPLGDGTLTDAADASVDLAAFAAVRLAHRAVLDGQQVQAWQQHLQDYRVTPLFEQLARPLLDGEELGQARAITEHEGCMLDTATLRTVAGRLGYQRGPVRHNRTFTVYEKPFAAAGLTAVIDFTGSSVLERNMPCALLALRICGREGSHYERGLPLATVPRVLLSETWNDLREIAAAGGGFDPQWRARVLWT